MQETRRARGAAENVGRGKDIHRSLQRYGISWIRLLLLNTTRYRAQCWCTDWCADIGARTGAWLPKKIFWKMERKHDHKTGTRKRYPKSSELIGTCRNYASLPRVRLSLGRVPDLRRVPRASNKTWNRTRNASTMLRTSPCTSPSTKNKPEIHAPVRSPVRAPVLDTRWPRL